MSAVQIAHKQVINMVLNAGDLPGYTLHSEGSEALKDQLPKKGMAHYALATRLVTANWLASEHSDVVSPDDHVQIISDANLFKSGAAAARISMMEQDFTSPGVRMKRLARPVGAPAGAMYSYATSRKLAGFQLTWVRGPVIAYVFLGARPGEKFTPIQLSRIADFLVGAARAQDLRIANVQASGAGSA